MGEPNSISESSVGVSEPHGDLGEMAASSLSGPGQPGAEAATSETMELAAVSDQPEAGGSDSALAAGIAGSGEKPDATAGGTQQAAESTAAEAEQAPPGPAPLPHTADDARVDEWQRKVLPWMLVMISALALFFLVASAVQLVFLHQQINYASSSVEGAAAGPKQDNSQQKLGLFDWDAETLRSSGQAVPAYAFEALAQMELYAIERRYHQANVLLMSRVWVRYLGFVTGMILAFLGATFILGKMREPSVELNSKITPLQFSFAGSSPGIFLAFVGVALMITTVVTHHEIEVNDTLMYVGPSALRTLTGNANPLADLANEEQELSASCVEAQEWLVKAQQMDNSSSLEEVLAMTKRLVEFTAKSGGTCPDIESKAKEVARTLGGFAARSGKEGE